MNDFIKGTLLLAGGIVIGAAAALIVAPQTGEETRKQIADFAEDAKKRAKDYCEQLKQELAEVQAQVAAAEQTEEAPKA
ncbi:MAG: YtxH domain-containing protein [Paludibacteraceae bacterium]|nr:YtxH domain-containing protein [Paludibacteraceae bacterium]